MALWIQGIQLINQKLSGGCKVYVRSMKITKRDEVFDIGWIQGRGGPLKRWPEKVSLRSFEPS